MYYMYNMISICMYILNCDIYIYIYTCYNMYKYIYMYIYIYPLRDTCVDKGCDAGVPGWEIKSVVNAGSHDD